MGGASVNKNFTEELIVDLLLSDEFLQICFTGRFLGPLIAGKGQDFESPFAELLVQLAQLIVVERAEAAVRGDVYNQTNFVPAAIDNN